MYCSNCGTEIAGAAVFCSVCGMHQAQQAGAAGRAPSPLAGTPAGNAPPAWSSSAEAGTAIDFRRLGAGDMIAGIATVLIFISLFLPWYSYGAGSGQGVTISALGTGAGGWRILVMIMCILIVAYLFARTLLPRGTRFPLPHWQVLTVLTVVNGLLVLLAFLVKPGGSVIEVSWAYGAYVGLVAGIVAIVGGVVRRNDPEVIIVGSTQTATWHQAVRAPGPPAPVPHNPPASNAVCTVCGTAVQPGNQYCVGCGAAIA